MSLPANTALMRADFVERVMHPQHQLFVSGMVKSSNAKGDALFPPGWSGEDVCRDMQSVARRAELFSLSTEMFDLITYAAESLPPQKVSLTDLPTDEGWLHLPESFLIYDVRGLAVPIREVMWSRRIIGHKGTEVAPGRDVDEGLVLWSFVRLGDPDDPLQAASADIEAMKKTTPMASLTHCQTVGVDALSWKLVGGVEGQREDADHFMRSLHDAYEYTLEQIPGSKQFKATTMDGNGVIIEPDPLVQFLMAYWHFCNSELTETEPEHPTRQITRSLKRREMPTGPVTVVRLRRPKGEKHSEGNWSLTYRHIRRGHWRKQWYGSKDSKYQKHIWIAPTVVGPEDAPLVERDVVNLVVR